MKKVLAIITVSLLLGSLSLVFIPGVALAADPADPQVTVDLTISGGGTVNTNINLSGSTVNAKINGSTLATLPDVQNMGNSLNGNISGTAADLQNAKNQLIALINQVKTSEDVAIQGQGQAVNLYGDAIAKLITDLSNLKNTQALNAYSTTSDVQVLRDQLDTMSRDLATLNDEIDNTQLTNQQKIQGLTNNLVKLQTNFDVLTSDTQTNYKVLADAMNASNQRLAEQKIKSDQSMTIVIIASDIVLLLISLIIIVVMKRTIKSRQENTQVMEVIKENHAYSGK